jgi:hypothetical protein
MCPVTTAGGLRVYDEDETTLQPGELVDDRYVLQELIADLGVCTCTIYRDASFWLGRGIRDVRLRERWGVGSLCALCRAVGGGGVPPGPRRLQPARVQTAAAVLHHLAVRSVGACNIMQHAAINVGRRGMMCVRPPPPDADRGSAGWRGGGRPRADHRPAARCVGRQTWKAVV